MTSTSLKRLALLDFGLFRVNAAGGLPARDIGIPGYLIQTADGRNILVDCGWRKGYADDYLRAQAEDDFGDFGHIETYTPHNTLEAQLGSLGLHLQDIDTLILTHTHIDHCGRLPELTHCNVVMQYHERALPRPLYSVFDWPQVREWTLLSGDFELMPGLMLLHSPGHAIGLQALLLQLPSQHILLATDAIDRASQFDEGFANPQTGASAKRLVAIAKQHNAFVIYGHDPVQWPGLKKAPAWFE
jgi:N-acyl homoserine lactone hydrolase